ncbi:MAG: SMP-30/gluconolactonase/LRE family protein [Nitriliruptorales bacterium]|nr:SMP-30/gluconolactonase/LRE family protein [Nitriliruptorales bacterium]
MGCWYVAYWEQDMSRGMLGSRGHGRRLRLVVVLALAAVMALPTATSAAGHVSLVVGFNEAAGEAPEGIAVDKRGNIFVSIAPLGQLWKIPAGSTTPEPFGAVAGVTPPGDLGILGLAVDAMGNVYAGVQSADPDVNGVYRFDRRSGDATKIPGSANIGIPNDVAFDKRGNLYISDSAAGAIWRVPRRGNLEMWLADATLAGTGALLGVPIGANGIEYRHGVLYVAVTEQATIVTVPVQPDGDPGTPTVLTSLSSPPDGLSLDAHGTVYAALISESKIVAAASDGSSVSDVAVGAPLDWPSSIAFGTSRGQQRTLYAVNFSIGEAFDAPSGTGPGVLAIDVGVPGMPLP